MKARIKKDVEAILIKRKKLKKRFVVWPYDLFFYFEYPEPEPFILPSESEELPEDCWSKSLED